MLLRCLDWRKRKSEDRTLLYTDGLVKIHSENIEARLRTRRISFAGIVARN